MARRTTPPARRSSTGAAPNTLSASAGPMAMQQVSGNPATFAASASIHRQRSKAGSRDERGTIAKRWQIEAYRHVNICGEARYAATLFASIAGRAELGISEPQALRNKATWITSGPEVDALSELCPTVRERTKLIRDYMLHRTIAGECYLIARRRLPTDPGYEAPPINPATDEPYDTWEQYITAYSETVDLFEDGYDDFDGVPDNTASDPNVDNPIWEIVGVTEIQRVGDMTWQVRHDNGNMIDLNKTDPVIRMWNPDPEDRREAWSPFRSLMPTLVEIEWLTKHIFTQVRSRLMSAGVWFLPDNLTFAPPPLDAIGGDDPEATLAAMNEAEMFMLSLAASGMSLLDAEEVSFPSVVLADPAALAAIDQEKLIKFWSEIDDKAMTLRSDAVRRFALGMDLPPEQVLGSSGLAVSGTSGSAGSVNHWGEWAKEEQTIQNHIEPALDDFVGALTAGFLRLAVEGTAQVIAYDTASLRLRQDLGQVAVELYDRGLLKGKVTLKETGFDPEHDAMDPEERKLWLLTKIVTGQFQPEQMTKALDILIGIDLGPVSGNGASTGDPKKVAGRDLPPNLDDHPYQGPPRVQHDQTEAPFSALAASAEALVLRAMEKQGNRLLNDGKRGREKDRSTPAHLAHLTASLERTVSSTEFDFALAPTVLANLPAAEQDRLVREMRRYCADMTNLGNPYHRDDLLKAVKGL